MMEDALIGATIALRQAISALEYAGISIDIQFYSALIEAEEVLHNCGAIYDIQT